MLKISLIEGMAGSCPMVSKHEFVFLMKFNLDALNQSLAKARKCKDLIVGFSGGIDSSVLLHGVLLLSRKGLLRANIKAIHINHKLNKSCDDWESFCTHICSENKISLEVKALTSLHNLSEGINEELLRKERYRAFSSSLDSESGLLLAHHKDDQLETLLLRLNRGSGMKGLSGIQESRPLGKGIIFRPLLKFDRQSIAEFAKNEGLEWVEDKSNLDTRMDRNFLRHEVLPQIESRWPKYRESWFKSLTLINVAYALEQKQAEEDMSALSCQQSKALDIKGLGRLSPERQRAVLKYWCFRFKGVSLGWNKLCHIVDEFLPAAAVSSTNFYLGNCKISSFRGFLHLVSIAEPDLVDCVWDVSQSDEIVLENNGLLKAKEGEGEGISFETAGLFEIRYRKGGEMFKVAGGRSKSLKKIFQEKDVEPWMRSRVPLIYQGGELISIVGVGVSEDMQAKNGRKGYSIAWIKPRF